MVFGGGYPKVADWPGKNGHHDEALACRHRPICILSACFKRYERYVRKGSVQCGW